MSKRNKIFVIIAAYNGRQYWPELMPLLSQEHYSDFDLEILVVDNHSGDDTIAYLHEHFPRVTVIANQENLGFVGANNAGYEYAKKQSADYIYLLNQDTVVKPGWLQPLYDFARTHKFGSLQSKLLLWPDTGRINTLGNAIHFLGFGYGLYSGRPDRKSADIKQINYASGAGVFLSMKVIASLDGPSNPQGEPRSLFDETMFMYLEDLDLGWSLSLLGYDSYLIPNSIIYHKYDFNRSMKNYYWFERNRLWIMLKNYKWQTLLLIFPAWLIMEVGQLFYALWHRRFWQKIKSYFWLLSSRQRQILKFKRRQIQVMRVRSDRQVVGKFTGLILFQELSSPLLDVANVFFYIYWTLVKYFIFW